jgi:hypothetical protein
MCKPYKLIPSLHSTLISRMIDGPYGVHTSDVPEWLVHAHRLGVAGKSALVYLSLNARGQLKRKCSFSENCTGQSTDSLEFRCLPCRQHKEKCTVRSACLKIEPTDLMCDLMQVGAAILALVASTITGSVGSMRTFDDRFLGAAYQSKSVMC